MNNWFNVSQMQDPFGFMQNMGAAAEPFKMMQNMNPFSFMNGMNSNADTATNANANSNCSAAENNTSQQNSTPFANMFCNPFMNMNTCGQTPPHVQNMQGMPQFDPMQSMASMMMPFMMMNMFMQNMNTFAANAVKQAESKQKNTMDLGGIKISPDGLHKLLSMDVSPESLNVLQKILDLLFSAYTKPKESNE